MDKNCIYYTIFIVRTRAQKWRVASLIIEQYLFQRWFCCHQCEQLRDTRELMYISHPFYSCFNSLSGPFRNYACRSCLLKLVLINCILWKVQSAHRKCIIRFLPFWLLWNPSDICSYATKRTLICFSFWGKKTAVSLVYKKNINSHEEMATVSVYRCNVLQYSFFYY